MPEIWSYVCTRSPLSLPVLFTPESWIPPPSASVGRLPSPPPRSRSPPPTRAVLCVRVRSLHLPGCGGVPSVQVSDSHTRPTAPTTEPRPGHGLSSARLSQICLKDPVSLVSTATISKLKG